MTVIPNLTEVYTYLSNFAGSENFWQFFDRLFGNTYNPTAAENIRRQWEKSNFSSLPPIRVLDSGMNGIAGAYVASTDTIYLSQSFLDTASPSAVIAVILEEIGHSIDAKINNSDSKGDEGKLFSALVRGILLTDQQMGSIQSENDSATIVVDGQPLSVETYSINYILSNPSTLLFSDNFTATGNPITTNLDHNQANRQVGSSLGLINWVGSGNAQVGNNTGGIDSGNYLLLADSGSAALNFNFNGVNSRGGLKYSFFLAPNVTASTDRAVWGSFNIGLSALNKNAFVNLNVPHFGILFRSNGGIQAFDGSVDVTRAYNSWGGTSSGATLQPFSVLVTDPTDNNPFDGIGQTNIDVYAGARLIYSYVKNNGGYRDNYINFGGLSRAGVDNLRIERLAQSLNVTEGGAEDTYSLVLNRAPIANVTIAISSGAQLRGCATKSCGSSL